jgi:hypothetical protein
MWLALGIAARACAWLTGIGWNALHVPGVSRLGSLCEALLKVEPSQSRHIHLEKFGKVDIV